MALSYLGEQGGNKSLTKFKNLIIYIFNLIPNDRNMLRGSMDV